MGKFFNGKVKKDRTTLIKYLIIGGGVFLIILLFILIAAKSNKKNDVILETKDSITIEVNSDWPKVIDFFTTIENYDTNLLSVDYLNLDISEVGEYEVKLNAKGYDSVYVKVKVVDTTAPELELKAVTIDYGENYSIENFIASCVDNSETDCIVEYFDNSTDQYGSIIDFSSFTEPNTYPIMIVAKDLSDNKTDVKETKLIINDTKPETPPEIVSCSYGNLDVSSTRVSYPIAVIVGDEVNNCALNRDLWDDADTQASVSNLFDQDYESLKNDAKSMLETNFPNGAKIVAYPHFISILNDDFTGLVGYAIYVKVYIVAYDYTGTVDTDDNLALTYYVNSDHTRQYIVNKYNLQ